MSIPSSAVDSSVFERRWDYVIVGAGAAGCVLANRLSAAPDVSVLLIEAGEAVEDPMVSSPQAWPALQGGAYDWNYQSTSQQGLHARVIPQPRGRGLGGSTLINAMGFQRGPRQAYDEWGTLTGDAGWGYEGLLPYFKRSEATSSGDSTYRGGSGPVRVLEVGGVSDINPHARAIAQAGREAGFAQNADWNGVRADGVGWAQLSIRDGHRETAATAYLDPLRERPNLKVLTGARVLRLDLDARRCRGVVVRMKGVEHQIVAERETILCAGALDTPRLLLLSGVGPADEIVAVGLQPVVDLPGVGKSLQDHPLGPGLLFQSPQPLPLSQYNHCEVMVVGESRRSPGWADIQVMGLTAPFLAPSLGAPPADSFALVPCVLRPKSRGSVRLASADPDAPALIDPAYLQHPDDVEAMVDGLEMGRRIASAPALKPWIAAELFPGSALTSRTALADYARRIASPFFHPASTCRMGPNGDPLAVVDTQCRVRGVNGLRIVDASIFPSLPQAMPVAAVYAVAERAADIVLESAL
jgi:choline dehydrogenase-like flavoprotein